ncbi:MAG: hypothetical protein U0Q55_08125 [Vicinamibacterales bacterium]
MTAVNLVGLNYVSNYDEASPYSGWAEAQRREYPFPVTTITEPHTGIRGNDYWRWKPRIIAEALRTLRHDQALIYFDTQDTHTPACFEFCRTYLASHEILLLQNYHNHISYTKADCYVMMGCLEFFDEQRMQCEAGFIGMRPTAANLALLGEWSRWMGVDAIVDDTPSVHPNHPSFIEHRWDQSVLTNLALLRGIPLIEVPGVSTNERQ